MNYCNIKYCDIANGEGVRTTLFVSGCTHYCKGCFNSEAWDFDFGEPFTEKTEQELIEALSPFYIDGLTLLGGEPFEPQNQEPILQLLRRIKKEMPEKSIWAFSGYLFEKITSKTLGDWNITEEYLSYLDVLVDGPYIEAKRDITLPLRGSSNQNILYKGKDF